VLHGQDTYTRTIVFIIVFITRDLDRTLSNALQWVGTPEVHVILKLEQRSVIVKFACGFLWNGFGKSLLLPDLFVLIVCRESIYVAGVSVVVAVLPSSCSFLLRVDKVRKTKRKCHRLHHVTTRMSFAPFLSEYVF